MIYETEAFKNAELLIDLQNLVKNYRIISSILEDKCSAAAVVKANAYGLGDIEVFKALSANDCNDFFVATLEEGLRLRSLSISDNIYVLNGLFPGQEEQFFFQAITPVLNDISQVALWDKFAKKKLRKLQAAIHVDTGINRLGLDTREAYDILARPIYKNIKINLLISHLACASDSSHPMNAEQLKLCSFFHRKFPEVKLSLANGAGIMLGSNFQFDMVRPGSLIYGFGANSKVKLKPVVRLTTKIIQVKTLRKSGFIGYEASYFATAGTKLAVISFGYADGIHRSLNKDLERFCYVGDFKALVLGHISMDYMVIDVTNIPEEEVYVGADVEMIGGNILLEDFAQMYGMTPYNVLTSIGMGKRIQKKYIEA